MSLAFLVKLRRTHREIQFLQIEVNMSLYVTIWFHYFHYLVHEIIPKSRFFLRSCTLSSEKRVISMEYWPIRHPRAGPGHPAVSGCLAVLRTTGTVDDWGADDWPGSSWVIGLDGKSFPNDLMISRMVDWLDIFLETLTDFNSLSWCWRFLLMNIAGMRHCHSSLASMYLRVDFEKAGHLCFVSADTCSILLGWKLFHCFPAVSVRQLDLRTGTFKNLHVQNFTTVEAH